MNRPSVADLSRLLPRLVDIYDRVVALEAAVFGAMMTREGSNDDNERSTGGEASVPGERGPGADNGDV